MAGQAHRLAGIGTLGREKFVKAAVDTVGQFHQALGALGNGQASPLAVQRRFRRRNRRIDFCLTRFVYLCDDLIIQRRAFFKRLVRGDILPINKIQNFFHDPSQNKGSTE